MQQRPSTAEQTPETDDHDPLTTGLPKEIKPIQSIVWGFIAIGVVGLIFTLVFVAFR